MFYLDKILTCIFSERSDDIQVPARPSTARAKLVATLTEEILSHAGEEAYLISSEHELCRRFDLSRVTVRLALSDLENRGLIFRRHGKGTFAHASSSRVYRNIGILVRPSYTENRAIAEFVRGIQAAQTDIGAGTILIGARPAEWRGEMTSALSGIVVIPWDVLPKDIEVLKDRNLPYLMLGESELPGPRITLGQREAARKLTEKLLELGHRRLAIFRGLDARFDEPKRAGVYDALKAAGIDPATVREFAAQNSEIASFDTACDLLKADPRPTAVIAFDDTVASVLSFKARRHFNLRVPEDISIVSFHHWPFLIGFDSGLHSVLFDFFKAGKEAAAELNRAAQTGAAAKELTFPPTHVEGTSIGPVPA